jgi:hypothetical protein
MVTRLARVSALPFALGVLVSSGLRSVNHFVYYPTPPSVGSGQAGTLVCEARFTGQFGACRSQRTRLLSCLVPYDFYSP